MPASLHPKSQPLLSSLTPCSLLLAVLVAAHHFAAKHRAVAHKVTRPRALPSTASPQSTPLSSSPSAPSSPAVTQVWAVVTTLVIVYVAYSRAASYSHKTAGLFPPCNHLPRAFQADPFAHRHHCCRVGVHRNSLLFSQSIRSRPAADQRRHSRGHVSSPARAAAPRHAWLMRALQGTTLWHLSLEAAAAPMPPSHFLKPAHPFPCFFYRGSSIKMIVFVVPPR